MKKTGTVLILSLGCVAWLFAQELIELPQASQPAESGSEAVVAEPVVADEAPAVTNEVPTTTEEIPSDAEKTVEAGVVEVDQIGMAEEPAVTEEIPADAEEALEEDVVAVDQIGMTNELAVVEKIPVDAEEAVEEDVVAVDQIGMTNELVVVEEIPADVEEAVEEKVAEVDQIGMAEELAGEGEISDELISLSLKDVELQDVVRMFSRLSGVNIIVPDLTQGQGQGKGQQAPRRIDVNLDNVEWKPALQAILDTQNLELFEKIPGSEVYSIRTKLPAAQAPRTTRTYVLNYADINNVAAMVKGIIGDQGQVFSYPQGNSIVVKTTQDVMNDVSQVIEKVDLPRRQVQIEARIMELSDENRNARGVNYDWGNILGDEGWSAPSPAGTAPGSGSPLAGNLFFNAAAALNRGSFDNLGGLGTLTLNAADMDITLEALQQSGLARVVSNPRVVVANGETAKIEILEKVPKVERSRSETTSSGGTSTITIEVNQDEDGKDPNTGRKRYVEYEFGIRLEVTPTIYTAENIAVDIVPIISRQNNEKTITSFVGTDSKGNDVFDTYYATDEKRVNTTFILGDQRTAVIGGLTETRNRDIERKVPLLGSIPLIRHLFTYKEVEEIQTENIIFVTVALEDGMDFDIENAVSKSPLTRQQMIRDENNQRIQDRKVEILKETDDARVENEIKEAESKAKFDSFNRKAQTPLWDVLRP